MGPAEQDSAAADATPTVLSWANIAPGWSSRAPHERRAFLNAAAQVLHDAWQRAHLPVGIPLDGLTFQTRGGSVHARLPGEAFARHRRATPATLYDLLADWHRQTMDIISRRESARFLCSFFRAEEADRNGIRHAANAIKRTAQAQTRHETAAIYRSYLADPPAAPASTGARMKGRWDRDPALQPQELLRCLEAAESGPGAVVLKSNTHIRVVRAPLLGFDALIKRYDINRLRDRIKYQVRPSRARRAWAAARTLLRTGILTPEPLGYLEIYEGRLPVRSYVVTRFMPDTANAYRWVKQNWRKMDADWKARFRQDLLDQFLLLYRKAIYHADTKLPNVMIVSPDNPAARRFYWIDLECVQAGRIPSRHQIVRNLVQLNGSMRHWVAEEDRLPFLRAMAQTYPWVDDARLVERIRRWTKVRHLKELHRRCGY